MLVSPLMGPVMSITFGAMISDRELMVSVIQYKIVLIKGVDVGSEFKRKNKIRKLG